MACKYIYEGKQYSKEELIAALASGYLPGTGRTNDILKSTATRKKKKHSQIVSDNLKLLEQRYLDAKNMLQALKNSKESKESKLKKTGVYKLIMERTLQTKRDLLETSIDKQLDFILDQAKIDANLVKALYTSKYLTFTELQFAKNLVDSYLNMNTALGITDIYKVEDEDLQKKLGEIMFEYRMLDEKTKGLAIELIKQSTKLSEEEITKIVDTSFLTEWTRELSTTGIPIANKLAYIIKEVNLKINREHNDNFGLIEQKHALIKDNPLFQKEGFGLFLKEVTRKDKTKSLAMVGRYSSDFWKAMGANKRQLTKEKFQAAGDKAKINAAYRRYHQWNETNTVPFHAQFFLNMAKYSDAERTTEINRMKSLGFNEQEINDIIAQSQARYERYLSDREEYEAVVEERAMMSPELVPTGVSVKDYVAAELKEWETIHDPMAYLEQKFTKGMKMEAYGAAKYVYLIPVKSIKGVPTTYYEENFTKISSDPKLYEFYSWFNGFVSESLSWFPQEEIEELGQNFLPVIAERLIKEYGMTSMKDSVAGIGDWFLNTLTTKDFEKKIDTNPYTKKERRGFDAKFINEDIPIEERSKDLVLIAKMFSDMALIYKHKNTIKAEVDTINDMIQQTKGSYKVNKRLNSMELQAKDATRIKSLAEFTVRKGFYGIASEDSLYKGDDEYYDWKELASLGQWKSSKGKKAQEISLEIQRLNEALKQEGLTDEQIDTLEDALKTKKTELYELGGRKFSLTQAIDSSISLTRLTALGFSPFSAARNLVVGKINNYLHAKGGRDFDLRDLSWANKTIISLSGKYWSGGKFQSETTRKVFGLMADANMAEGEDGMYAYLQTMVDKKTPVDKLREMLPKAFTWLQSGDFHFKAEMLMASMKRQQVVLQDGSKISFYDALTEDRKYNEAKYGAWDMKANGDLSFDEFYLKNMLKYRQLANKLHGTSGKESYVKGKDTAIGRLVFLFKSWLPETVGVRFDPKHKDALLDRFEEGYYRTFFNIVIKQKLPAVIRMMAQAILNRDVTGIDDEMELANFKKMVHELKTISALMLSYMVLKAVAPDDDKDKKIYNLLVLRQLYDLNRDLTYYMSINSAAELQKNVFPVFTQAKNWAGAFKAVAYHGFGIENEDGEEMYDSERTLLKVSKVIPVLTNINKTVYYMKDIN